jgi:hypothetical protein
METDGLPYIAAAGGSLISIMFIRRTFRRFDIGGKWLGRAVVAAAGILAGSITYFFLGFIFPLARPDLALQIKSAIHSGFGIGAKIISGASVACVLWFSRRKNVVAEKQPEGSVRQRLLNARADILRRIESLKLSPVHDYRGGIPEPDILIEGLREKLNEIDSAIATLEPD